MKSAYELAMERLEESDPQSVKQLTDKQREALAEVDSKFQAKIAERKLFLNSKIRESKMAGDREAVAQIEKQLRNERMLLEEQKETEKDKIRNQV